MVWRLNLKTWCYKCNAVLYFYFFEQYRMVWNLEIEFKDLVLHMLSIQFFIFIFSTIWDGSEIEFKDLVLRMQYNMILYSFFLTIWDGLLLGTHSAVPNSPLQLHVTIVSPPKFQQSENIDPSEIFILATVPCI